jgi:hypothetical protein
MVQSANMDRERFYSPFFLPKATTRQIGLLCLASALCLSGPASAANLIQNSTFTSLSNGFGEFVVQSNGTNLTTGTSITQATHWNATYNSGQTKTTGGDSYPFLFIDSPSAIDTTGEGFPDAWDNGPRYIWGPSDGSNNGYTGAAPGGGNILIMDADYHPDSISQTISAGLVKGTTYSISVNWAAAQWSGNTGATTEMLSIMLGDQTFNTTTVNLPSEGFSGWMTTNWSFVWDGSSNILSMLASGGPSGLPPIVLVDSVQLLTPEPASWGMLVMGAIGIAGLARFVSLRRQTRRNS